MNIPGLYDPAHARREPGDRVPIEGGDVRVMGKLGQLTPRATQLALFGPPVPQTNREVALTPEVAELLASGAVCAVGVSGGKDSVAAALTTAAHLDAIGHAGARLLVHSDLGRVEWRDSLPACERLARHIGWELLVVRRGAGDLIDRWETRWANNVARYANLSTVGLILPWSTPAMRFCTSELKTAVISSALRRRFPDKAIVSVSGIRRQESATRARMPVARANTRLTTRHAPGLDWHPIHEWKIEDVLGCIAEHGLVLHEAYTAYGASRVSCSFCIMSSHADLIAAASCADNQAVYRRMVDLEIRSTFAFQGARWLGDIAPELLSAEAREALARAQVAAIERQAAERAIPDHLRYSSGWPTVLPTPAEAELLAATRRCVARSVGIMIEYDTADAVMARYRDLLGQRARREVAPGGCDP